MASHPNRDRRSSDRGAEIGQQTRLWLLSLVCATVGAVTVWRTGNLATGIGVFAGVTAVLGTALWLYERRRR